MGQYIGGLGPDCVSPQPDLRTILLVHIDKNNDPGSWIPHPYPYTFTLTLIPLPLYLHPYPYTLTLTLMFFPLPLCFYP